MNPPAIIIRLELEAAPRVYCDYLHDDEEARMHDWLEQHPDYLELVHRALELAEARAA